MNLHFFLFLILVIAISAVSIIIKISFEKRKGRQEAIFAEVKKDLIFSRLVSVAETAGFKIEIKNSSLAGMIIFFRSKKIWVWGGLLIAFAEKIVTVEAMRLVLAHELGHLRKRVGVDCQLLQNPTDECLYAELLASLEALSILEEAGEENLEAYQSVWSPWLTSKLNKQCGKCLKAILANKCPKKEDVKIIDRQIEEILKIKK